MMMMMMMRRRTRRTRRRMVVGMSQVLGRMIMLMLLLGPLARILCAGAPSRREQYAWERISPERWFS